MLSGLPLIHFEESLQLPFTAFFHVMLADSRMCTVAVLGVPSV